MLTFLSRIDGWRRMTSRPSGMRQSSNKVCCNSHKAQYGTKEYAHGELDFGRRAKVDLEESERATKRWMSDDGRGEAKQRTNALVLILLAALVWHRSFLHSYEPCSLVASIVNASTGQLLTVVAQLVEYSYVTCTLSVASNLTYLRMGTRVAH
jgi:hypothetical protein